MDREEHKRASLSLGPRRVQLPEIPEPPEPPEPPLHLKESENQLIRELEEYKKLTEDYLGVVREWYERAVRKESDIDKLFRGIGEQEISMRGLSYRVFGYDRGDARKFIDKIEGIIAILKGEEFD